MNTIDQYLMAPTYSWILHLCAAANTVYALKWGAVLNYQFPTIEFTELRLFNRLMGMERHIALSVKPMFFTKIEVA